MRGRAAIGILAVLTLGLPAQADELPDGELQEHTSVHLRTVRVRVRPSRAAAAGECSTVARDDLRVRLRGEWLPKEELVELARPTTANLHALLLDMSGSMSGREERVRSAAAAYVQRMLPGERALVVTFDESVVLAQAVTDDAHALIGAVAKLRIARTTSLYDGLWTTIQELDAHELRPVIVLMTDGEDSSSLHTHAQVRELLRERPRLVVFVLAVPEPSLRAREGLQRLGELAEESGGELFFSPGWHLEESFLRIRERLDSEALLTFVDAHPEQPFERPTVRARQACRVEVYPVDVPFVVTMRPPFPRPPATLPFLPERALGERYREGQTVWADPRCGSGDTNLEAMWTLRVEGRRVAGCTLDVVRDAGLLYDATYGGLSRQNRFFLKTRYIEFEAPPWERLPTDPVTALDEMATRALEVADARTPALGRLYPERHARSFDDLPFLLNGTSFLRARVELGRAVFVIEDYRAWLLERLAARAERELAALADRLHRVRPQSSRADIESLARSSAAGRAILARGEGPTDADLRGGLAAWLADLDAETLFREWERRHVESLLAGAPPAGPPFADRYAALRQVFFLPSHVRVLALMRPFFDAAHERIGFFRVVLPRDEPLGGLPERPFAYLAMQARLESDEELSAALREGAYRVTELGYERQPGEGAAERIRVRFRLESDREGSPLEIEAGVRYDPDSGATWLEEFQGTPREK